MGPGILPETTVSKHNLPCHLQMPTKALSCKKEALCEHGPETTSCPVGQDSFKIDCFKVEKSKCNILVGNQPTLSTVLEGAMNAERYIMVVEQHMFLSRRHLFQGRPCVFQQDNAKPHTAAITTAWLRSRRVWVLNWPARSPDLSSIENIWHIIK